MSGSTEPYVKILFEIEDDEDPDQVEVESVWARPVGSGYQIDNIPFFAYSVACGDIVEAIPDEGGMLVFKQVLTPSGNSVVRIVHTKEDDVQPTRDQLRALGCESELWGTNLVAVNVPDSVDYSLVRAYLDQLAARDVLDYEEACLGHLPHGPTS